MHKLFFYKQQKVINYEHLPTFLTFIFNYQREVYSITFEIKKNSFSFCNLPCICVTIRYLYKIP